MTSSASAKARIVNIIGEETRSEKIQERLKTTLIRIRKRNALNRTLKVPATALCGDDNDEALQDDRSAVALNRLSVDLYYDDYLLRPVDKRRIRDWSDKIAAARTVAAGIAHLNKVELERLQPALQEMELVRCASEGGADEIAARIHTDAPWLAQATEYIWHALRLSARRGDPVKFQPVIVNGPPGIGKSVWTRAVARELALPFADIDASKNGAGFSLVGVERGWSTAQPGRPLELILAQRVANPIIVVDEICKAKTGTSSSGSSFSFSDALLSLLEPATAHAWECPYFRITFDLSRVSWILTSNDPSKISEPVRSRCQLIQVDDLTQQELRACADRQARRLSLTPAAREAALEALERAPRVTGRRTSLRDVSRILDRAVILEGRPVLQ